MSEIKLMLKKLSALFIAGFVGVLLLNFVPALAQLPSESSAPEYNIENDLAAFNLDAEAKPIIPEDLGQTENPAEGARLIFGQDDRLPMITNKYPWSAVGRIQGVSVDGNNYICTGALIAPDVVLTNAHCVIDPDTHQWSRQVSFAPNLVNGRLRSRRDLAYVTDATVGTNFRETHGGLSPDDWAILRINKPLGYKYGTLSWQTLPTSVLAQSPGEFILVGYSGDFPENAPGETASAHVGCSIRGEASEALLHDCDAMGGSSGGPILGQVDGEYRIVGINFGSVHSPDTGIGTNLAVKVSRIRELF